MVTLAVVDGVLNDDIYKSCAISSCPSTSERQFQLSEFSGLTKLNTLTQYP